jgi:hypothetical protein
MANRAFHWTPTGVGGVVNGSQILDGSIGGSKIIPGNPTTQGTPSSNGFFDNLGKIALGGLGLAAGYALLNYTGFNPFGSGQSIKGGGSGDDGIITNPDQKPQLDASAIPVDDNYQPVQTADAGTSMILVDTTPPQPDPIQVASDDGFDTGGDGYAEA